MRINKHILIFLAEFRYEWDNKTRYFQDSAKKHWGPIKQFDYKDSIAAHISQAIEYPASAKALMKDHNKVRDIGKDLEPTMDLVTAVAIHLYIDCVPLAVEFMKDKGFDDQQVEEY